MTNLALASLLAGLPVAAWLVALWRRARGIERVRDRWIVRALSACAALGLWLGTTILIGRFTESGTWFCRVCARCEEHLHVLGLRLPLGRTPPEDGDQAAARPFQDWFAREVALEHVHDWAHSGCHARGWSTVACSRNRGLEPFYVSLPRAPDQDTARALATKLVRAPRERRRVMLEAFGFGEDSASPFGRLANGETLTETEFATAYAGWLARQPLWR